MRTDGNADMKPYFGRLNRELLREHGLQIVAINVAHKTDGGQPDRLPDHLDDGVHWVASIEGAPGAGFDHAVVMRGRELAHDPNSEDLRETVAADIADRIACVVLARAARRHPPSRENVRSRRVQDAS
jgi:hypothetical protein